MPVGFREDENPGGTLGIRAGSEVRVIGKSGRPRRPGRTLCRGGAFAHRFVRIGRSQRHPHRGGTRGERRLFPLHRTRFRRRAQVRSRRPRIGLLRHQPRDQALRSRPRQPRRAPRLAFGRERDAKEEVFEIVTRLEAEVVPAVRRIEETATAAKDFFEKLNERKRIPLPFLGLLEKGVADMNRVMAQAASGDSASAT